MRIGLTHASPSPIPTVPDSEAIAADVLAKLLQAPDELRELGAPECAVRAAEEIARTAKLLLDGKSGPRA